MSPTRKPKKVVKKIAKKPARGKKPAPDHKPAAAHPAAKAPARPPAHSPAPSLRGKPEAASPRPPAGGAGRAEQAKGASPPKKSARKSGSGGRREGKSYAPGDLLLPGGCQTVDEIQYFFRGCVSAEHPVAEEGLQELLTKRSLPEGEPAADEIKRQLVGIVERFASGAVEPMLPSRSSARKTFSGFVERARGRRREIGAFLRGLDLGRTEVSHLDSHSETSLQNLMEWTARIEKMVEEGEEPEHADYNQLHRGTDQLDNTTEALIVDLETTLRRLRERAQ
jgi:hypothetical protein